MSGTPETGAPKILVVSNDASDASQVAEQLLAEFSGVRAATNKQTQVRDFEAYMPDVLVLAFHELGKAQEYLVGVLRLGDKARSHKFRTVLLCEKGDVTQAFALCKRGHFDDYVLYWPLSYEGSRLPMCVWVAVRALAAASVKPTEAEMDEHFSHLEQTAELAAQALKTGGERIDAANQALQTSHASINAALDEIHVHASEPRSQTGKSGTAAAWAERLRLLHENRVKPALDSADAALAPVEAWRKDFQGRLGEKMAQTGEFIAKVGSKRPALLVVDDDPLARKVVAAALAGSPYALLFAADGEEAFLAVESTVPDLVLMDVNLPGRDGVAVTRQFKSTPRLSHIPVLMLTGDARPETVSRSIGAGASSFLVKPYTRAALLAKLQMLLKPKPSA